MNANPLRAIRDAAIFSCWFYACGGTEMFLDTLPPALRDTWEFYTDFDVAILAGVVVFALFCYIPIFHKPGSLVRTMWSGADKGFWYGSLLTILVLSWIRIQEVVIYCLPISVLLGVLGGMWWYLWRNAARHFDETTAARDEMVQSILWWADTGVCYGAPFMIVVVFFAPSEAAYWLAFSVLFVVVGATLSHLSRKANRRFLNESGVANATQATPRTTATRR